MIRGFRLFHKLNLKNLSAEDLFNKYMSEFNPGEHSCPWCDTKDPDWKKHAIYGRWLISFENGAVVTYRIENILRNWWRKRGNLEDYEFLQGKGNVEIDEVFSVVMGLPDKYKMVIYLYYYEGYDSVEIAKILEKPQSTIRNYLSEARRILRERLGGNFYEE